MFHPIVQQWFDTTHDSPTPCQLEAWPAFQRGESVLVAAPTGSGKTLAAFLAAIDALTCELDSNGTLSNETRILYISPLKALSNDIEKNLREPLDAINSGLADKGITSAITAAVRTGDTPASVRAKMKRTPPHILVTTPESLFILLTSVSGRDMLSTVTSVIVDEIHALAANKRGAHLSLSLERLCGLTPSNPVRIGLSATQKPLSRVASFLKGSDNSEIRIIDSGLQRHRDLEMVLPDSPLEAVMSAEVWGEIHRKLVELIATHSTTLIFVNTRRQAERIAHKLAEIMGDDSVTSHHGSLSREHRLDAETRLKNGQLTALVATASLELGIDVGDVDLVCQLGSPRAVSVFLQRVGRSGHGVGRTPKGRLFPLSRDDLIECAALLKCSRDGLLDEITVPVHPLDVLAQQIVGELANQEYRFEDLFTLITGAYPYSDLTVETFETILQMLSEGFATRRGRRGALIHVDLVNRVASGRKGARLTALTNGGAIPDLFDYDVIMEPEGIPVGTLNEDFAFDSTAGDIFQLGNTSYQILRVERGVVRVIDAKGKPPNIPFWFGEAPGRGDTLSDAVSELRSDVSHWMEHDSASISALLQEKYSVDLIAGTQIIHYLGAAWEALGRVLPTKSKIVAERFFDESGDMHLVIHTSFGSRMNRAYGLALRKRFCRRFNFELQAAALEDCIVLSLGETHSFSIDEVAHYLDSTTVEDVLTQAILDAPVFPTHWRWVTNISLAVRRFMNGKKVPAQFQRSDAEDLVAVVFPDQLACLENIQGEREIPKHPLVDQALWDCLHDVMDVNALKSMLTQLKDGNIEWISRDLVAPSPLSEEVLTAKPYAFLDDAPAEERRTLAVRTRGLRTPVEEQDNYSILDPNAILKVRQEAWPDPRNVEEMHDALVCSGFITDAELDYFPDNSRDLLNQLIKQSRVTTVHSKDQFLWCSAERLSQLRAVLPDSEIKPEIKVVNWHGDEECSAENALVELLRSRLEVLGPVCSAKISASLGIEESTINTAMLSLANQGFAIEGQFDADEPQSQWCDRRLLARIHRYTLKRLRAEVEPVSINIFMRFLFQWQHLTSTDKVEGVDGVGEVISQLEGFGAPLKFWETTILPARVHGYIPSHLDQISLSGKVQWQRNRNRPLKQSGKSTGTNVGIVPIAFYLRDTSKFWKSSEDKTEALKLSQSARKVLEILYSRGASFYSDIQTDSRMLAAQLENALSELVATGLITCDSFNGFRALLVPQSKRPSPGRVLQRRSRRLSSRTIEQGGRWSATGTEADSGDNMLFNTECLEYLCDVLLHRYGIVCRAVIDHEKGLPPWRLLLPVLRRLEARGEVRGGRFIAVLSGEQFALPEAVEALRKHRNNLPTDNWVKIHASDPMNFTGEILPGSRVSGDRWLLFKNGTLVASGSSDGIEMIGQQDEQTQWKIREKLLLTIRPPHRSVHRPSLLN